MSNYLKDYIVMNKILSLLTLTLALMLAACGAGTAQTTSDQTDAATPGPAASASPLTANYENALPIQTQLIVGTFKLEETDLALTSDEAAALLPLWQAVRALSASDTAASEELNAVVVQIQETMRPEQLNAIAGMQLTREDMSSLFQELGLAPVRAGQPGASGTPAPGAAGGGFPPGGGFPGGDGFPAGGFPGGGAGQNLSPEQQATLQALRENNPNGGGGFNNRLVDELIELLEAKAEV
jgi:hypothetical protein